MTPGRARTIANAAALAAALGLAGCAEPAGEERAFAAGWRTAQVIDVAPSAEIASAAQDCRREWPAPTPDTPYALLRYTAGTRHHRVEASTVVPADAWLQPGARVCVNVGNCRAPPVPAPRTLSYPSCAGMAGASL